MAIRERGEPRLLEHGRSDLVADAIGEEVVVGVLQQQRDAARALDTAARRFEQPVGVAQERRLAGAVASHQRDPLAGREREIDAAQHGAPAGALEPHAAKGEGRQRPRRAPAQQAAPRPGLG